MTGGRSGGRASRPAAHTSSLLADVPSAIQGAQRHIAEAHGSFELEEMIEDVLEDVPESEAG